MIVSPSRNLRPASSLTSSIAFNTPLVTSSNGASTVVGASPRTIRRYSPSRYSMRIAFVVVLPQSVAKIVRIFDGSIPSCSDIVPPPALDWFRFLLVGPFDAHDQFFHRVASF